ncbi:MAG TPA: hypothetical protein VMY77_05340 [Chitinophagaceae bacterium]|nr:hypothetical protein [Chitinophagaceae bacterium]
MEAHHPHHVTHKKRWTEYLLEFFMLFLAVFLGFVAENQREHMIEHNREKKYMQSMIEDLRSDTTHLSFISNNFKSIKLALDTMDDEFSRLNKGFSSPVYRNLPLLLGYEDLIPNDRTLQQLKNAGGMRLIRNQDISDSIMNYDKQMKELQIEQSSIWDLVLRFRNLGELVDIGLWKGDDNINIIQHSLENKTILLTHDRVLWSKYRLWVMLYKQVTKNYLSELGNTKEYAIRLIAFIGKEYDVK